MSHKKILAKLNLTPICALTTNKNIFIFTFTKAKGALQRSFILIILAVKLKIPFVNVKGHYTNVCLCL